MKTILVPIDFSVYSENALKFAYKVASEKNITVHLLHCSEIKENYEFDVEGKLGEMLELGKELGVSVISKIEKGYRPHKIITTYTKSNDIDMIIMGSHGLTPGESQFLGSNSQRVVRYSPCPVLTIKTIKDDFKINRIIYPSNFNFEIDKMFLKVIDLATFFGAKIELVYINTPENFNDTTTALKKINSFLEQQPNDITNINIYNDFNSVNGILNFSKSIDADIIAMETLGKSGIHRFLENSITENIVNFSEIPVLSLCSSEM